MSSQFQLDEQSHHVTKTAHVFNQECTNSTIGVHRIESRVKEQRLMKEVEEKKCT